MTLETIAVYIGYLGTLGGLVLFLWRIWGRIRDIAEGQRCLLRTEIMRTYYRHCDEKEPGLREYERKNLDSQHEAYKALRGNTFEADIYDEMRHWHVDS